MDEGASRGGECLWELCEGRGCFTGDPGGCVKKGSGDEYLSPHRGLAGEPGTGIIYQGC